MKIDQRHYNVKPTNRSELLIIIGFSAVFLGGVVLEVLTNYEPRKLAALFFILWWMPLVLWHEFGHALMAHWMGWRIERTVVGFGRVIYQGSLFNAPLEVRAVPIEGFVQFVPETSHATRWQHALIYFAGPGIELWLAGLIILSMGWDNFLQIDDSYSKLAWQALAYAALAGAIVNLIPMGIVTSDGDTPNDGMGIVLSLLGKQRR